MPAMRAKDHPSGMTGGTRPQLCQFLGGRTVDAVVAKRMEEELLGTQIGRWTFDRVLGHGKSAIVFLESSIGQQAAVKVFDREMVARFGAEIQRARMERERELVGRGGSRQTPCS